MSRQTTGPTYPYKGLPLICSLFLLSEGLHYEVPLQNFLPRQKRCSTPTPSLIPEGPPTRGPKERVELTPSGTDY